MRTRSRRSWRGGCTWRGFAIASCATRRRGRARAPFLGLCEGLRGFVGGGKAPRFAGCGVKGSRHLARRTGRVPPRRPRDRRRGRPDRRDVGPEVAAGVESTCLAYGLGPARPTDRPARNLACWSQAARRWNARSERSGHRSSGGAPACLACCLRDRSPGEMADGKEADGSGQELLAELPLLP